MKKEAYTGLSSESKLQSPYLKHEEDETKLMNTMDKQQYLKMK